MKEITIRRFGDDDAGITRLVREIEQFMKRKQARGIHVDTPVNNELGRNLYTWLGYKEDCIRSEYYGPGSDAVVYLYLFR